MCFFEKPAFSLNYHGLGSSVLMIMEGKCLSLCNFYRNYKKTVLYFLESRQKALDQVHMQYVYYIKKKFKFVLGAAWLVIT